jgi:Domain of unknown function (DUF892)
VVDDFAAQRGGRSVATVVLPGFCDAFVEVMTGVSGDRAFVLTHSGGVMPDAGSLHDAFINELRDAYDAEQQLIKALPKLARTAVSPELQKAFTDYLEQTRGHVERLVQAFETEGGITKGPAAQARVDMADGTVPVDRANGRPASRQKSPGSAGPDTTPGTHRTAS